MSISLSGSLSLTGSIVASGNLTTTGTITAQTLVVQTITSSIVNMTGSNIFGSILSDRQTFTGSVVMTGSLVVNTTGPELQVNNNGVILGNLLTDNHSITGSLRITGSGTHTIFGNVAIGTTSTFGKLSVVDTDNTTISSALWGTSTGAGLVSSVYNGSQTTNSVAGIRLITRDSGASIWNMYNISTGASTGDLAFGNGTGGAGTEKMRITNSGLVGIGITSPQSIFHIGTPAPANSGVKSYTGLANSYEGFLFDYYYNTAASNLRVFDIVALGASTTGIGGSDIRFLTVPQTTTGTPIERLRITNAGNVGIGTNNPYVKLDIRGGGIGQTTTDFVASSAGSVIYMRTGATTGNTTYGVIQVGNTGDTTGGSLVLNQFGGNVAIGNTSPGSKLVVNNAIAGAILPYINGTGLSYNSDGISVAGSNTNNTNIGNGLTLYNNVASVGAYSPVIAFSSMTSGGAYNATYAFITGIYQGAGGDSNWAIGDLMFGTGNQYGATERMRITSAGDLFIANTTNQVGASSGPGGWSYSASSYQAIATNSGVSLYLNRIATDGGILIFRKNGTDVGSISTNANSLPSDLNFKKNISNLDLGLNLVTKLRAVSYNHKIDDDDTALSTGFIAQELEQSLTELGIEENKYHILQHKPNEDETQSQYWLDYTKIIPVLTKAIQELNEKVNALENK
jgi:hypothetical protein